MYDLADHRNMVLDAVRVGAYARALRAIVRPDDVVLDLGCGIGIFAVLAARAGARRVYAVDPGDCVHSARHVVEENGVANRVEVVRGLVERVAFPEAPTVIVGDVRGPLPLDAGGPAAWTAAGRILAPGGRTIPRRDVVMAQPIASDDLFRGVHAFGPVEGVACEGLRAPLAQHRQEEPPAAAPIADALPLFEVAYGGPIPTRFEGTAEFEACRDGVVDGLRIGFEADLAPGVTYRSFGPGRARPYNVQVLPTAGRQSVRAGDRVRVRVVAEVVDTAASLAWALSVGAHEGPWQGELLGSTPSLDVLRAGLPGHVPGPDAADDLDAAILAAFGRGQSVEETIAAAQTALGPAVTPEAVGRRVVELSRRRQARVVRRLGAP